MTLIRRGSAKKKHEARVAWLQPEAWRFAEVPGIRDDVTETNRPSLDRLCDLMDARQLFGRSTREVQRETVRRLLSELRGEDVGVGW
jgi:hypothetical protein